MLILLLISQLGVKGDFMYVYNSGNRDTTAPFPFIEDTRKSKSGFPDWAAVLFECAAGAGLSYVTCKEGYPEGPSEGEAGPPFAGGVSGVITYAGVIPALMSTLGVCVTGTVFKQKGGIGKSLLGGLLGGAAGCFLAVLGAGNAGLSVGGATIGAVVGYNW